MPLALAMWGLFGAPRLLTGSFQSLVHYQTPYTERVPGGSARAPASGQVVLIVADGMRADVARDLPNLGALRARGAYRTARAGAISLSIPGYTVIGTGAWQEQHGQTTNFGTCTETRDGKPITVLCPAKMDSIFAAARRAGLKVALAGSPAWERLFPGQFDSAFTAPAPPNAPHDTAGVRTQNDAIEAAAQRLLAERVAQLTLIYFSNPDEAYHGYGVHSPEGNAAAADVDARIGRLLAAIDPATTTILFTSDHGHIDRGGHGGPEPEAINTPLIAAGNGIVAGEYAPAQQADIAPTVAALLGTPFPTDNQGKPLLDMMALPVDAQAAQTVDWAQQIALRYDAIARVIGVGMPAHKKLDEAREQQSAGDDASALQSAFADAETTRQVVAAFREGRLLQERLGRTPLYLLFLAPLGLYVWFMRRMDWEFARPLAGAVVYFVVYYALFFGRGLSFSLSMLNAEDQIMAWFAERAFDAIIALAAASAVLGVLCRDEYRIWTTLNTINFCFFVAAGLGVQIAGYYWMWDFAPTWYLPDISQGFKFYLDTLQSGAFFPTVRGVPVPVLLALPLIALAAQRAAEQVAPTREGDSGQRI